MILEMKGNTYTVGLTTDLVLDLTYSGIHLSSVPFQHATNEITFAYFSFYNFG